MAYTKMSPDVEHLVEVIYIPQLLHENKKQYFHMMTFKLLFFSKINKPDILEAMNFLTTRVKGLEIDNYKKIDVVIRYIRGDP